MKSGGDFARTTFPRIASGLHSGAIHLRFFNAYAGTA
jgi:hypothetical protein